MTPYDFVHGLRPRTNKLTWPDFWYMQNERREVLNHLQETHRVIGSSGFRTSALYTCAEQVKEHVTLLQQGVRNTYRYPGNTRQFF